MRIVGRGEYSVVYETDDGFGRQYDRVAGEDEQRRIAIVEGAFVRLRHDHLLPAYGIDVRGDQLAVLSPRYRPLPDLGRLRDTVLNVVASVAEALAVLHAERIVHLGVRRDAVVAIENADWGLRPVLCDHDGARHLDLPVPEARTADPVGSSWRAPELRAFHRADLRSDIYGLGVLLFELAFGCPPPPEPVLSPSMHGVKGVLGRLLAAHPDQRPGSAADVLDELERIGWQRTPGAAAVVNRDPIASLWATVLGDRPRRVWLGDGASPSWQRCPFDAHELWHHGDQIWIAPDGELTINAVRRPRGPRVPLTPGDVVDAGGVMFTIRGRRERRDQMLPDAPDVQSGPPPSIQGNPYGPPPSIQGSPYGTDHAARFKTYPPSPSTPANPWAPPRSTTPTPAPVAPPPFPAPPARFPSTQPGTASAPGQSVRCSTCQHVNPAPLKFCLSCGSELPRTMILERSPGPPAMPAIQRIGAWTVIERLGAGATSEAFRAERAGARGVAKRLLREVSGTPEMQARFRREIAILGRFQSVAIPRLLDHGNDDGREFLVMEDAGSTPLAARLRDGPLAPELAITVIRDVLAALAATHASGVTHRDIKPSNVFLPTQPGGFAKLADFGIAHNRDDGIRDADRDFATITGVLIGTPSYMSPEQARGVRVSFASDLYGAGCVLHEMLSGRPPFTGHVNEVLTAHVFAAPPPLPATVPAPLAAVVMQLLAKQPAKRPASAAAARDLLDAALPAPAILPPADPRLSNVREVEPGIFEASSTTTSPFGQLVLIDHGDRRDGPRARLDALRWLSSGRRTHLPTVIAHRAIDGERWAQFVIAPQPPEIPPSARLPIDQALGVAAGAAVGHAHLAIAGRGLARIARSQVRTRHDSAGELAVELAVIDPDVLPRDDGPGERGSDRLGDPDDRVRDDVTFHVFALAFDLALGDDDPPSDWPEAWRKLVPALRANQRPDRELLDECSLVDWSLSPAWEGVIEQLEDELDEVLKRSSATPAPAPAPTPEPAFAVPPSYVLRPRTTMAFEAALPAPDAAPRAQPAPPELPHVPGAFAIGQQLGSWRVLRLLGEGGMARVFEVEHAVIGKRAVAKTLLEGVASQAGLVGRFIDEARAVNAFHHPNIVDIFDIGQDSRGLPFMIMELVPGRTLAARLGDGALAADEAIEIARQVAAGLGAAHAAGIVHRDVKPANIVIGDGADRAIKILDFGIARVPRESGYTTRTGTIMGTPHYMAPEQMVNSEGTDPRGDIYALGVTLYEMLTGKPPFSHAQQIYEIFQAVRRDAPEPPVSRRGPLPPELVALVMQMLEKDPARRPQSCDEVIAALDRIAARSKPRPLEDELREIGLSDVRRDGMTAEGLPRLRARDGEGPVTVYHAPAQLVAIRARARADALRYLARERPPLFVPIIAERALPADGSALIRRDPVPPPLPGGRIEVGPALAIAVVVHRALALLLVRGRRFEAFDRSQVRAALAAPDGFACLVQPPLVYDHEEAAAATMVGNEYVGNVQYMPPDQLMGRDRPSDVAYAAGVLAYELIAGQPPFPGAGMHDMAKRKANEDPPKLAARAGVPAEVAAVIDRLIARDSASRSRPPATIEAELLGALGVDPAWHAAALRTLTGVDSLDGVAVEEPRRVRALVPTLAPGERLGRWTVESHLRFGGDAEVYVVRSGDRPAICKLWYADGIDPLSEAWERFADAMHRCAERPGFPKLLEFDKLGRDGARGYAVFEHIEGPDWKAVVAAGARPTAEALALAARLVATLADAHDLLGLVGDVSASNVIVRGDRPVLLDVMTPGRPRDQRAGYGTPGYLAPEVVNGQPPAAASDVFSAGVLIAELALGRRLFGELVESLWFPVGGFELAIAAALADMAARHGARLAGALRAMLAIDPAARPTARAAAEVLHELAERARVRAASSAATSASSVLGHERRLPRPIAQALRSWRITAAPTERIMLGFGLAELIARYLAGIALADYLSGAAVPALEARLGWDRLERPTFGTWLAIGRQAAGAVAERGDAFVPELAAAYAKGNAIEALVPLRNDNAHGRPVVPDGELDRVHREVTGLIGRLLAEVGFLAQYPLVVTLGQRARRDGQFDGSFLELHGPAGEPERRGLVSSAAVPAGVALLASPDLSERLIVEPFVIHRPCPRCSVVPHTYVIAGVERGEVHYHDQASSHPHRELPVDASGERTGFRELIKRRAELALRGALRVRPADAERFWVGDSPVRPGQTIGGFELQEEIGRGAMGVVYRAYDRGVGRACAVKIVRPELLGDDRKLLYRLRDEAHKLGRLAHPHVVRVFQSETTLDDTNCFLAMELLEGGSLDDRLRTSQSPALDEVLGFGRQLVGAICHVHAADIVHRDLKPANVLFAAADCLKVVDFGMARDLRATSSLTVGFAGATPLYCAPEQQAGGEVGRWTDVYALGLLLFDLVRGKPATLDPLRRVDALRRARDDVHDGHPHPDLAHHGADPRLPALLDALVAMTQPDPERRPASDALQLPS